MNDVDDPKMIIGLIIIGHNKVKDVRVPENLQRAMAAEAEAARNARAKVMMINIIVIIIISHDQHRDQHHQQVMIINHQHHDH